MKQNLVTELKQTQRLTPLQMQFVRVLEMTTPEVEDEVQRALDEMPALEAVDNNGEALRSNESTEDGSDFTETAEQMQRADFSSDDDVPEYLSHNSDTLHGPFSLSSAIANDFHRSEQSVSPQGEGLTESLETQLADLNISPDLLPLARYIIGSIDPNGYLSRSIEAIANDYTIETGHEVDPRQADQVLTLVQTLDPAGIGARSLQECLLLQINRLPRTEVSVGATEIIKNHFDLFAKKHYKRIASRLGIPEQEVVKAAELIRHLDPKPGGGIADSRLEHSIRGITPDFYVDTDENGALTLSLAAHIPVLRIEPTFEADPPTDNHRNEEARIFIRSKRDDARNFIKVMDMRRRTLTDVMTAIIKIQQRFFQTDDEEEIVPMVLRNIAELTGYNLSVISRATQGKYVATHRNIYPLKMFFNERVKTDNDTVTANRIIAALKRIIEAENKQKPLSDREITDILTAQGLDVARRTVAKYRETLGFPVARLRRRT